MSDGAYGDLTDSICTRIEACMDGEGQPVSRSDLVVLVDQQTHDGLKQYALGLYSVTLASDVTEDARESMKRMRERVARYPLQCAGVDVRVDSDVPVGEARVAQREAV